MITSSKLELVWLWFLKEFFLINIDITLLFKLGSGYYHKDKNKS